MKILSLACAAACTLAFATGTASSAFAESTTPGAAPPTRTGPKVTPPPRGRELDKFTARPKPPGDKAALPKPGGPAVIDDVASLPQKPKKSLTYTCSESWCMELVINFCDKAGGGLVTNPDGSVTCTIGRMGPVVMGSFGGPTKPPAPPRTGPVSLTGGPQKPVKSGLDVTCSSTWCMKSIVAGCDKNGGGLSTNPDGSVTCSL